MKKRVIEAIYLNKSENPMFKIVPSNHKRGWMDETQGHAYRCIPLNVANQYGWNVLCPIDFTAEWDGGDSYTNMNITIIDEYDDAEYKVVDTHFGHGVLTFVPDFILRTPKNISTYVRPVPNLIANGIQPLDAVIETDWLPFTFTYNLKFTKPGKIRFYKDQPIFNLFPVERAFLESFDTKVSYIDEPQHKDLKYQFEEFLKIRMRQNNNDEEVGVAAYGKAKMAGIDFDPPNHTKRISLDPFKI